jgi:hypothetical protein
VHFSVDDACPIGHIGFVPASDSPAALIADLQTAIDAVALQIDCARANLAQAQALGFDLLAAGFADLVAQHEAHAEALLDLMVSAQVVQLKLAA